MIKSDMNKTAQKFGLSEDVTRDILQACKLKLKKTRDVRPKPHLDDKVITSWNGTIIFQYFVDWNQDL